MHGAREALVIALAEELPRDDGATRTETDAEPDGELGKRRGGLNAAKGDLSADLSDDKRDYEVVGLLEERRSCRQMTPSVTSIDPLVP